MDAEVHKVVSSMQFKMLYGALRYDPTVKSFILYKKIAELENVNSFYIDEIINWFNGVFNKENYTK